MVPHLITESWEAGWDLAAWWVTWRCAAWTPNHTAIFHHSVPCQVFPLSPWVLELHEWPNHFTSLWLIKSSSSTSSSLILEVVFVQPSASDLACKDIHSSPLQIQQWQWSHIQKTSCCSVLVMSVVSSQVRERICKSPAVCFSLAPHQESTLWWFLKTNWHFGTIWLCPQQQQG